MGLKRENRLRRRREFLETYKHGRTVHGALFTLFILDRADDQQSRFGFTVTKRLGKAVERNRLRRRLRECARNALKQVASGVDIVVNAKHPAVKVPGRELAGRLVASLRKARVYRE